ncbi:hypothetical protein [Ponticoccus alexandrii]|nr:hypothetical protein [Ponticoccus alexandrii]
MLTVTIMGVFAAASVAIVGTSITEETEEAASDEPSDDSSTTFDIDAEPNGLGFFGLEDRAAGPEEGDLLLEAYKSYQMGLGEAEHLAEIDNRLAADALEDESGLQDGRTGSLSVWDDESAGLYSSAPDSYAEMLTGGDSAELLDGDSRFMEMLDKSEPLGPDNVRIITEFDETEDVILYVTGDGTLDGLSVHHVDPENVNTDAQIMDQGIHVMTVIAAGLNFGLRNIIPLHDDAA